MAENADAPQVISISSDSEQAESETELEKAEAAQQARALQKPAEAPNAAHKDNNAETGEKAVHNKRRIWVALQGNLQRALQAEAAARGSAQDKKAKSELEEAHQACIKFFSANFGTKVSRNVVAYEATRFQEP